VGLVHIKSEITGSVWKIQVRVGDMVEEDDVLMILESMKMEIPVLATEGGVVQEIKVEEGHTIKEGDVAVVMETE
jgi:acetyl-CoA carboxylase biotin carboxyl carrier protein